MIHSLKSLFVATALLAGATLNAQEVFRETFGTSPLPSAANNFSRAISSFMPSGSFAFATPYPASNDSNVNMIDNNHYAVVAPPYIYAGSNPANNDWYFWTKPYNAPVGNGNVDNKPDVKGHTTGAENDAVMVINAGTTLAPFYQRNVSVSENGIYEVSMWLYVVQATTQVAMDVYKNEKKLATITTASFYSPSGAWQNTKLYFTVPTCAEGNINDLRLVFRNNNAANQGNDYYIDDLSLTKVTALPPGYDANMIECPEPDPEPVCTEPVNGNGFGWSYNTSTTFNGVTYNDGSASNGSQVERNFTQPASDYGFELNIYKLDNSFNMKVNNQPLTNQEIQFQANHTQNIRFKSDGGLWGSNGIPNIWQLTGDDEKPIIRVKISPTGAITFWGKRSNDPAAEVEELELIGSHQVNTNFTWNSTGSNNILVGQKVDNITQMIGSGFGLKKVPCICYNPASNPGTGPDTKVGITLLKRAGADAPGVWPMARKSGHIALESNTKGFVVTRMTTSQIMTGITTPQEGMMVYDTEEKCLKLYDGTAWSCFNTPTCP